MAGKNRDRSTPSYNTKERFNSYWHQIDEIEKLEPENVLEIGIGHGFVSEYLKKYGFEVTTVDYKEKENLDVIANVVQLPFEEESFDVVVAFQILEHLPFEKFENILSELYYVCRDYVVISVPDVRFYFKIQLELIKFIDSKKLITLPLNKLLFASNLYKILGDIEDPNSKHHYWEIGRKGFPMDKIKRKIKEQGFNIQKNYRVYEMPYHTFFVLKK